MPIFSVCVYSSEEEEWYPTSLTPLQKQNGSSIATADHSATFKYITGLYPPKRNSNLAKWNQAFHIECSVYEAPARTFSTRSLTHPVCISYCESYNRSINLCALR